MSIRIEVKNSQVAERSGEKNGKPWTIRNQTAWAYTFDREGKANDYPLRIEIQLEKDQSAYAPGNYSVAPTSFMVGDYDKLALGRLALIPVTARAAAAA